MLISTLYEPMRLALGDELIAGAWAHPDDMIAAYIRQPIKLGMITDYLALNAAETEINPDPNSVETGLIILKAACLFFGAQKSTSWRTRAASYSEGANSIQTILRNLNHKIAEVEESGGVRDSNGNVTDTPLFAATSDLSTWTTDLAQVLYGHRTLTV